MNSPGLTKQELQTAFTIHSAINRGRGPIVNRRYSALTIGATPAGTSGAPYERIKRHRSIIASILIAGGVFCTAQDTVAAEKTESNFDEIYTKHEYRIPMRDGVKLFTIVFTPKDTSSNCPILLQRTPYNLKPYTIDAVVKPGGFPDTYVKERFILAKQDVRGRFASEGVFADVRPYKANKGPKDTDESTDAYDTIDWLVKHVPHNNGKVGLQGISYLGFYAAAGMIHSHPALKAVSPQAPCVDLYDGDDSLHGGGFWLCHNFDFFYSFDQKLDDPTREAPRPFDFRTPDGYRFFLNAGPVGELGATQFKGRSPLWDNMLANLTNWAWCEERDLTRHYEGVHAAVLTVGGWFDAEDLHGALKTYRMSGRNNPGIYNGLVMGPWSHGGWHGGDGDSLGPVKFHSKTAEFFREQIEAPFFRRYLKGDDKVKLPEAYVFETGTDEWRQYAAWPPTNAVPSLLQFSASGRLEVRANAGGTSGFDEYISDPNHPVPFTQQISTGMPREYMVEDQRFAGTRPDVLVYQSEPLEQDMTVVGPVTASLFVSTTGSDSDWVVKLIDVYTSDAPEPNPNPGNIRMGHYEQLVRGEPFRGKFRNGYDKPQPFTPGEVTKVEWTMPDICHTFRASHRIMVQVQSSWFPLLDRNPQTFCDIYHARPEDFRVATQRVYYGKQPSGLKVMVMPTAHGESDSD